MKEALIPNPVRPQPDNYHARLGMKLDPKRSKVYNQIEEIRAYARSNEMKLNGKKCKFMVFNPTQNHDFEPDLEIEGSQIETQDEMKYWDWQLGMTLVGSQTLHRWLQKLINDCGW